MMKGSILLNFHWVFDQMFEAFKEHRDFYMLAREARLIMDEMTVADMLYYILYPVLKELIKLFQGREWDFLLSTPKGAIVKFARECHVSNKRPRIV